MLNCCLLFHDGGRYHIETSPLICSENRCTGFYMITAFVMKELNKTNCNDSQYANQAIIGTRMVDSI